MKVGNLDRNRQEIDMLFQKREVVPLTKVVLEKLITIYFHMFLLSTASRRGGFDIVIGFLLQCQKYLKTVCVNLIYLLITK